MVTRAGKYVFHGEAGYSDIETLTGFRTNTICRLLSMSKVGLFDWIGGGDRWMMGACAGCVAHACVCMGGETTTTQLDAAPLTPKTHPTTKIHTTHHSRCRNV